MNKVEEIVASMDKSEVLKTLESARFLLSDKSRWCKGMMKNSRFLRSTQYCAMGSVYEKSTQRDTWAFTLPYLNNACNYLYGFYGVVGFNDESSTTHEQILEVFDHAIENVKKEIELEESVV